jgi:hypothetical protein
MDTPESKSLHHLKEALKELRKVVIMDRKDYLTEHKKLIKLLMSAHEPSFTKEAKKQKLEVKNKIKGNVK